MTRERCRELLPVMQAYAEGKELQVKIDGKWQSMTEAKYVGIYFENCKPSTIRVMPANEWYQKLSNQFRWWIAKELGGEVYAFSDKPILDDSGFWFNPKNPCKAIHISKDMFKGLPEFEGKWDETVICPEEQE